MGRPEVRKEREGIIITVFGWLGESMSAKFLRDLAATSKFKLSHDAVNHLVYKKNCTTGVAC